MPPSAPDTQLGRQVLVLLQDVLAHADPSLCRVIIDWFSHSDMEADISVVEMARQLGVTMRTVQLWAKAAGFRSVKRIVIAAQFVRVWPMLRQDQEPRKGYAKRYGYSWRSHLKRHSEQLVKCLPKHIKLGVVSTEEAAKRIAAYMRREDPDGKAELMPTEPAHRLPHAKQQRNSKV